jgi:hypothetical protein
MKIFRNFTILICVLLFSQLARAQNVAEPRITIHLDSARFNDFVKDVERQTGYFFYYDAARFDSLTIDLDVKDQTIRAVLDQVFRGSDFTYALDAGKRVYITEGQKIITQLQPGLFNPNSSDASEPVAYVGPDNEAQEKLLSTAESKVHEIGVKRYKIPPGNSTITGYVRSAITGEPVIGAAVFIETPSIGVTTDALGFYALTIPRGKQKIKIKSFGMRETQRQIVLYSDGKLDIEMRESVIALKEVSVKAGMIKM